MTLAADILRAPHIGVRDLKTHLSQKLKRNKPLIVTEHGSPKQVLIPYSVILDIVEVLEELEDTELTRMVRLSRESRAKGVPGIPVAEAFKKFKARRSKR